MTLQTDSRPDPVNPDMQIRLADPDDAGWMLDIYTPVVRETATSFEYLPPTLDDFRGRIERVLHNLPWLACIVDGEPAGYAYASSHRDRAAYQWSVESSVYIADTHRGRGVGRALYSHLFGLLKEKGFRNVYGGITLPNAASVALHRRFGFREIGIHRHTGFKFGKWHDVLWMQSDLWEGEETREPKPILKA